MASQPGLRIAKLENKPKLQPFLLQYLDAFFRLNRRRQYSMSVLPLSVDAILLFGQVHGFANELRYFYKMMEEMDDEYLLFEQEKKESETRPTEHNAPPDARKPGQRN